MSGTRLCAAGPSQSSKCKKLRPQLQLRAMAEAFEPTMVVALEQGDLKVLLTRLSVVVRLPPCVLVGVAGKYVAAKIDVGIAAAAGVAELFGIFWLLSPVGQEHASVDPLRPQIASLDVEFGTKVEFMHKYIFKQWFDSAPAARTPEDSKLSEMIAREVSHRVVAPGDGGRHLRAPGQLAFRVDEHRQWDGCALARRAAFPPLRYEHPCFGRVLGCGGHDIGRRTRRDADGDGDAAYAGETCCGGDRGAA